MTVENVKKKCIKLSINNDISETNVTCTLSFPHVQIHRAILYEAYLPLSEAPT
jgi:hypothetical protein